MITKIDLKKELVKLPNPWRFTFVNGSKGAYLNNWAKTPKTKEQVLEEIDNPLSPIKAVGVLLGEYSDGLVCVDHDGLSATGFINKLAGTDLINDALPQTVTVTSGREGRYSCFYRVPQEYWQHIKTRKIPTGIEKEQVELRWNGCQSVVIGEHPMTGYYSWIHSPTDVKIADAPLWVIEQMLRSQKAVNSEGKKPLKPNSVSKDKQRILDALYSLKSDRADNYQDWLAVGMALHSVGDDSLLWEWDKWSQQSSKYDAECCKKKWSTFNGSGIEIGSLFYMAKQDGWKDLTSNQENETMNDLVNDNNEIIERLSLLQNKITLSEILPETLAKPLDLYAQYTNIRPEVTLNPLLSTVGSLQDSNTRVVLLKKSNFEAPPNLFCSNVADSGELKTPLSDQIIVRPLKGLIEREKLNFAESVKNYNRLKQRYKILKQSKNINQLLEEFPDGEPVAPKEKMFTIKNTTIEGIAKQFKEHPNKGLLYYRDELKGMISSFGQYKGGKGDDREFYLQAFNGDAIQTLRAEGVTINIDKSSLSIFGSIQPAVLKQVFSDTNDSDGFWARFLFVNQPRRVATLPDDDESGIDITEAIAWYYNKIAKLPAATYTLSKAAFKQFQSYYNWLEQAKANSCPALANVYAKHEGLTGRLALNLHVLHQVALMPRQEIYNVTNIDTEISEEVMLKAIQLSQFYINEFKLVLADITSNLDPLLVKVLKCAEKNKVVAARDIILSSGKTNRPKTEDVRNAFKKLATLGYGSITGEGSTLKFQHEPQNQQLLVKMWADSNPYVERVPCVCVGNVVKNQKIKIESLNQDENLNLENEPQNQQMEQKPLPESVSASHKMTNKPTTSGYSVGSCFRLNNLGGEDNNRLVEVVSNEVDDLGCIEVRVVDTNEFILVNPYKYLVAESIV